MPFAALVKLGRPAMVAGLALAFALAATGCVKFKQAWSVNPDGSGKMTMTFGINEQMLGQFGGQDPFADLDDPSDMIDQEDNGWVAFTAPQITTENGYKSASFTGYFEDINQVTFSGDGGNGEMVDTTYALAEGKLTVTNAMLGQVVASVSNDPQMQDPQTKAFMAVMMEGLEMAESYRLPGAVTDAEGYDADGQTASTTITAADILGDEPPKIAGLDDGQLQITFTPAGWPAGGEAAWNTELEAAKAEWQAIKAAAVAPAAEQ
ncbi:MAG: hypothetical protein AAFX76_06935 [Planctomycetota bacterium]